MRLVGAGGDELELSIVGYQFPEADDPRLRFSWHMVEGRAVAGHQRWSFRWPALTCDESPRLAAWLRAAAAWADTDADTRSDTNTRADTEPGEPHPDAPHPGALAFTEPNLSLAVLDRGVTVRVGLDLELRPPSAQTTGAGHPTILHLDLRPDDLRRAARDLDADIVRYPDGLAAR